MKQQLLEKALDDMHSEIIDAIKHLGNVGRFDDYLNCVDSADDSLNRALQIYYEIKNFSASNLSKG